MPASWASLAWWPDGSVRWAKLSMPISLQPRETKTFTLQHGAARPLMVQGPSLPPLSLHLVTDQGTLSMLIAPGAQLRQGDQGIGVDVEPLSETAVRVRLQAAQFERDALWKSFTVEIPVTGSARVVPTWGAIGNGEL